MTDAVSSRQDARLAHTRIGISPLLVLTMAGLAFFVIYMVGVETLPLVHNAFHDLRHAAGFPCH
jgi:cobalt transporter subunit CbtB